MPKSVNGPNTGTIPPGGVRGLLEEVKRRILIRPYNQNDFCGTACCIAGQIDCILNGEAAHLDRLNHKHKYDVLDDIEAFATEALGEKRSPWLFAGIDGSPGEEEDYDYEDGDCWPPDLSREYYDVNSVSERGAVGCKAIDRYLEQRGL